MRAHDRTRSAAAACAGHHNHGTPKGARTVAERTPSLAAPRPASSSRHARDRAEIGADIGRGIGAEIGREIGGDHLASSATRKAIGSLGFSAASLLTAALSLAAMPCWLR